MQTGADDIEDFETTDFGDNLPVAGAHGPMVFSPEAIRMAARRLHRVGHAILLAPTSAEAGFLPPALPGEQTEAEAAPDPTGYLLRRRIARAIVLAYRAERSDPVVRPFFGEPLQIVKDSEGRPQFGGAETGLHLSFAARGGASLIGIARQPIGVDLEPLSGLATIPWNILRPDEIEKIEALPEDRRIARFLMLWTAKEAILKAMGTGLSTPPEAIRIANGHSIALRNEDGGWRTIDARLLLYRGKNTISDASIGFPHLTIALALLSRAPQ